MHYAEISPGSHMVKPFFTNSSYKETYFSTFDLKSRGWTVTMIRKLLPDHDAEKENHMQYQGHSGKRSIPHPVKLYDQERVKRLEDTEDFFHQYERAQKALSRGEKRKQTVLARKQNLIEEVLRHYQPEVNAEISWEENVQHFQPTLMEALQLWWDAHIRGEMLETAGQQLLALHRQAFEEALAERNSKPPRAKRRSRTQGSKAG